MDNIGSFIEDLNQIDNYDAMDATIDFITWKLEENKNPLIITLPSKDYCQYMEYNYNLSNEEFTKNAIDRFDEIYPRK